MASETHRQASGSTHDPRAVTSIDTRQAAPITFVETPARAATAPPARGSCSCSPPSGAWRRAPGSPRRRPPHGAPTLLAGASVGDRDAAGQERGDLVAVLVLAPLAMRR